MLKWFKIAKTPDSAIYTTFTVTILLKNDRTYLKNSGKQINDDKCSGEWRVAGLKIANSVTEYQMSRNNHHKQNSRGSCVPTWNVKDWLQIFLREAKNCDEFLITRCQKCIKRTDTNFEFFVLNARALIFVKRCRNATCLYGNQIATDAIDDQLKYRDTFVTRYRVIEYQSADATDEHCWYYGWPTIIEYFSREWISRCDVSPYRCSKNTKYYKCRRYPRMTICKQKEDSSWNSSILLM